MSPALPRPRLTRALLIALAVGCAGAASAAAPATVSVGGETKMTEGILREAQAGDIACYLTLEDADGESFSEMAAFELCEDPALIGQRLRLSYSVENVLAAECQGDVDCGKSDQVVLVSAAEALSAPVAGAAQPTLCSAQERVVFACRSGSKQVSVCASPEASATAGALQYRFGKPAAAPEMTLPKDSRPPAQAARGETVPFSGGGGSWLRFRHGEHAYVVYSGIGRWGPNGETIEKQGVLVEHRGEQVANLPCTGPLISELGPDWFEQIGISAEGEEFYFPE